MASINDGRRLFKNVSSQSIDRESSFLHAPFIQRLQRTRTRSRGKETRRTARPRATSPTPPRDRRRRPTPPYTKDSTRGDVNSTSFESMAKKTAKFQRQKAARSLWNQIPSKRRRHQPSASVVVGYAHITTDVDRVRLSRTTPSCSFILSPHHRRRARSNVVSTLLVSSRCRPLSSSSVARKRPARNRRCRVMCDYTTVTRRIRASRRVTTTPLPTDTKPTRFHGQVVRRPLRKGKIAGSNPVESI